MNSEDGQVCILQFSCFTKYNRIQSKHKETKCEHSDETHSDFSFLSRYNYTKSKNYFKRRYRIRHWIPMFIGTPCTIKIYSIVKEVSIANLSKGTIEYWYNLKPKSFMSIVISILKSLSKQKEWRNHCFSV